MRCPRCGLINDDDAQRCDCGYDFVTRTVERSYLTRKDREHLDVMSDTVAPASRLLRFAGLVIDWLVIGVASVLLAIAAPPALESARFWGSLLGVALLGLQWGVWGRSVGMVVVGLRLIDTNGGRPSLGQGFTRAFTMIFGAFFGLVWWPIVFRRDRRGLHDLVARTWVVRAAPDAGK